MTVVLGRDTLPGVTLTACQTAEVAAAVRPLLDVRGGQVDDPHWLAEAAERVHDLPRLLLRALTAFRRDSGLSGVQLVRGLPVDEHALPPTPVLSGSVRRRATIPVAALVAATGALGTPVAFRPEKTGAIVQDVVPVPGREDFQGNEGSVLLDFHTENAFHPHRPDHVLLLCVRADPERVAGLRTASIRQVLPHLDPGHRAVLCSPLFTTTPPPSFGAGGPGAPHPILTGDPDDPDLVVDFSVTVPIDPAAAAAKSHLRDLLAAHALTHRLRPGDLAIVDNRVTVHGRTPFTPSYDGRDRWLHRTFAVADLRCSRAWRPDDGHVLS